jgi:hypothetical protein
MKFSSNKHYTHRDALPRVRAVAEALAAISGVLGATGFDSDCPVTEVHCRCKPCAEGRT